MLECVVNLSEGRDLGRLQRIAALAGPALLDLHSDPHHNRSVLTLIGEEPVRKVATAAIDELDLRSHDGVHPRFGVVDVVPFVALGSSTPADAEEARGRFATWLSATHSVPCFLYGPERTLPAVRRDAFKALAPDPGPPLPHPTAGATAVGWRGLLVAYNVWVTAADLATVKTIAAEVRGAGVRALGLRVGDRWQVSMNLIEPLTYGIELAFDRVARAAASHAAGVGVQGAELVGLAPRSALEAVPRHRWAELGLTEGTTIETRLEERGLI